MSLKKEKIRILYLEDDEDDVELFKLVLKRSNLDHTMVSVSTKEEFQKVDFSEYDVIISDYNLKNYDGLSAIKFVRSIDSIVPMILLSGTIGEEMAVDLLRAGANDFVLKENLKKMPTVVERAVHEGFLKREKQSFQKELFEKKLILDAIFDSFEDLVFLKDVKGRYVKVNQAFGNFLKLHQAEIIGKTESDLFEKSIADQAVENDDFVKLSGNPVSYEVEMIHEGEPIILEAIKTPVINDGRVTGIVGQFRDITSRKKLLYETIKSRSILAQAEKLTNSGSFEYDADKDLIICSSNLKHMMRLQIAGDTISFRKFAELIKEEDRDIFNEGIRKALDNHEEYFGEHRLYTNRNGKPIGNFKVVFRPDYKDDKNIRFYGTLVDVTAEHEIQIYMMEKQEQDRKELARELHDNLGQKMNAISMFSSKISDDMPDNKDLKKVKGLVHESIDDLGHLINSISVKQIEEHSLGYAIDKLVGYMPEGILVNRSYNIKEETLSKFVRAQVYRVIQEALNNIIKYSNASKVELSLTQEGSLLDLVIEDNGVGFEVEKVLNGNGLQNITHRIRRSNGLINIDSEKGKGTKLIAKVPVS